MNRFLTAITIFIIPCLTCGKSKYTDCLIPFYETSIHIYEKDLAYPHLDKPVDTLWQSMEREIYHIEILEEGISRYKISYTDSVYTPAYDSSLNHRGIGWIDKKNIGVWPYTNPLRDEDGYVHIHEKPSKKSSSKRVPKPYSMFLLSPIPVDGFLKVGLYDGDNFIEGWTKDYCTAADSSCGGWDK